MSTEDETRAAAYRASKRRQVAAKAAAEARLLATDPSPALAVQAAWAAAGRAHPFNVPLIGDDQ